MEIGCILLAGGKSSRMGHIAPKPFLSLLGRPLFSYSLNLLSEISEIKEIVCVTPPEYRSQLPENVLWAPPGDLRQHSVENGLKAFSRAFPWTLTHDAARPLIMKPDLIRLFEEVASFKGGALGSPVTNSLKQLDGERKIRHSQSRDLLWEVYTPQIVQTELLKKGLLEAKNRSLIMTDDLSCLELLKEPSILTPVSYSNIKVTYPKDLALVEALLSLCKQ